MFIGFSLTVPYAIVVFALVMTVIASKHPCVSEVLSRVEYPREAVSEKVPGGKARGTMEVRVQPPTPHPSSSLPYVSEQVGLPEEQSRGLWKSEYPPSPTPQYNIPITWAKAECPAEVVYNLFSGSSGSTVVIGGRRNILVRTNTIWVKTV